MTWFVLKVNYSVTLQTENQEEAIAAFLAARDREPGGTPITLWTEGEA